MMADKCMCPCPPGYTHILEHMEFGNCIPNHIFDPNPPQYFGSGWVFNPPEFHTLYNQISNCQPGMTSGLYNPNGPLKICPSKCAATMLTGVSTQTKIVLSLTFTYTNDQFNKTVDIEQGKIYTFTYIENGTVKKCTGLVSNIYKVNSIEENANIYKIKIDCSANYANSVVIIKSDQVRDVVLYQEYAEEDMTIESSLHRNGTTAAAVIKDAIIKDASIDAAGNILKGTMVAGTITNGTTVDGVAEGMNDQNHKVYVINSLTTGGIIQSGFILYGMLRSGDIDGQKNDDTGVIENATINGMIANALIINTEVFGGKTENGEYINPVIEDSIVEDALITGTDMVTTGGITIGNITTGGTTVGGTANGGHASGLKNGIIYHITNGTTVAKTGGQLRTTGGVLTGGTLMGGQKIGNMTIGGVITGGTLTGGTTTGGITSGGTFSTEPATEIALQNLKVEQVSKSGSTAVTTSSKSVNIKPPPPIYNSVQIGVQTS